MSNRSTDRGGRARPSLQWVVATAAAVSVAVATGAAAQPATGAAQATTSDVVVLVAPGETGRVLSQYGLTARLVYTSALDGFAASVTDQQRRRLESDRAFRGIARDEQFTADAGTPIEASPQRIPRGARWVGATDSPSAAIDGIDATLDVDIAVLDTGIQPDQPDLRVVGGVDCTRGKDGYADDNGHGTMVAGVAAALDNSFGVVGVAPGARVWAVKVLNKQLRGRTSGVLCGIDWVTAHSDVIEVANMSLGGPGSDDGNCGRTKRDLLHQAICRSVAAGVTYVTSAGNDAVDAATRAPASYDEVITVSGLADSDGQPGGLGPLACDGDVDDSFAAFSNFGADIDIAAPAECIGSTYVNSDIAVLSGTSFAAPFVSGGAALYLLTHPGATPPGVRAGLLALRQQLALPGDPDGIAEGALSVALL